MSKNKIKLHKRVALTIETINKKMAKKRFDDKLSKAIAFVSVFHKACKKYNVKPQFILTITGWTLKLPQ